eukprot:2174522-Rhodomonas_salina.4
MVWKERGSYQACRAVVVWQVCAPATEAWVDGGVRVQSRGTRSELQIRVRRASLQGLCVFAVAV